MKRFVWMLMIVLLFSGCGAGPVFETVTDEPMLTVISQKNKLELTLPGDATTPTFYSEKNGSLYLSDGYTISVQTLEGGNMDRTLRQLTGFAKEDLTIMETQKDGIKQLNCVWSAAGEGGDRKFHGSI